MGAPPSWIGYVEVAGVDDAVAQVTANGRTVHMPPTVGRFDIATEAYEEIESNRDPSVP